MKNPTICNKTDFSDCVTLCAGSVYPTTGRYDSSADYWKVNLDANGKVASVIDDGDYENINVFDADGKKKSSTDYVQGTSLVNSIMFAAEGLSAEKSGQANYDRVNSAMTRSGLDYNNGKGKWFVADASKQQALQTGISSSRGFFGGIQSAWNSAINAAKGLLNAVGNKKTSLMSSFQIGNRMRNSLRVEGDSLEFWNSMMTPEVMRKYDKDNNNQGPQCNNYVADGIKAKLGDETYSRILPDGVTSANVMFDQLANNKNLEAIDTSKYSIAQIQAMADKGAFIIMAYKNPNPSESGHVAFVANSGVAMMSLPTSYNGNALPQSGYGYNQELGNDSVILSQAGTITGNVTMAWGTNGWNSPDTIGKLSYREYLLQNYVSFYTVRRR